MLIHSLSAVFSASSSCLTRSCTRFVARTPKTWWYQQWSFLADGDLLLRLDSDFRLSFCSDLSRERDLTKFETSRFSSSTFLLWCLCRLVANYHVSNILQVFLTASPFRWWELLSSRVNDSCKKRARASPIFCRLHAVLHIVQELWWCSASKFSSLRQLMNSIAFTVVQVTD